MVILNKIYTRTGDDGKTGLASGERRHKHDVRVDAYGTVDETNACIGLVRVELGDTKTPAVNRLDQVLSRIQNDLFDLGADLATPDTPSHGEHEPLRITATQVAKLEQEIDHFNAELEPLRSFVLPGGSRVSAFLHQARTVTRRAERLIVELSSQPGETVNPFTIQYMNRLSDFLFVAARHANDGGKKDVLWVPGKNR